MKAIAQAALTFAVFAVLGLILGIAFGRPVLGGVAGLITAVIFVLPAMFLGTKPSSRQSLRSFFLIFRSGHGP